MMLNEFLTENIFTLMAQSGGLDFVPPENLDTMDKLLRFKHGNKLIDATVDNFTIAQLADMVVILYKPLWTLKLELYDVAVEGSGGHVIKVTESTDRASERLTGSTSTDRVSGFNSNVMVDDSGSEQTGNEDLTESRNRVITTINNNPIESFNLLANHVKSSIIEQIVDDVCSFLTLKIYR